VKQRVLILGAKDCAARAAEAAGRAGIEAVVATSLPNEPEAMAGAARANGAEGIYCADEAHVEAASAASAKLGFPCLSEYAARLLHSKEALRSVLARETGLNPRYGIASSLGETEQIIRRLGLPAVVKPIEGVWGQGALIVRDIADAPLAFARAAKYASSGRVLLEPYLPGHEYRVICHRSQGRWSTLMVYSNVPAEHDHLFDRALVAPVRVAGPLRDKLRESVRTVMGVMGGVHGLVVLEFMVSGEGLHLVELSRISQLPALATELFPAISGVDLLEVDVASALGKPFDTKPRFKVCAALWWLTARSGVVSAVHGEEKIRAVPGVVRLQLNAQPGTVLGHQVDVPTRDAVGHVLVTARSPRRALEKAQYASEYVRIDTRAALGQ